MRGGILLSLSSCHWLSSPFWVFVYLIEKKKKRVLRPSAGGTEAWVTEAGPTGHVGTGSRLVSAPHGLQSEALLC